MNASAMVKHHQAVTAIMTQAMSDYASAATGTSWNKACFAFEADAILCALSRAGFRILGPDEVDQVSVERCAEIAKEQANEEDGAEGFLACKTLEDAIRALEAQEQGR